MRYSNIVIDESPYCVWDWELSKLDNDFLSGLNPAYFEYIAQSHFEHLDGANAQHAALAIRMNYSLALEALMSLLCAIVQAPDCVVGWLHKYRNDELDIVVAKITKRQKVMSKLNLPELSWNALASYIMQVVPIPDVEKKERLVADFGTFWTRVAYDFLENDNRREYNSIKHAFRVKAGGVTISAGIEEIPGVACPPEQMKAMGGSRFGSSFYWCEPVEGVEKCNLRVLSASRNWVPKALAHRIILIGMSMQNVLSFLKMMKGADPTKQEFRWPGEPEFFAECWRSPGMLGASFNTALGREDILPRSKDQILAEYARRKDGDADEVQPAR